MTTVAWDGNTLACDSMMTCGSLSLCAQKMHRIPLGVAAIAGTWHYGMEIIEWLRGEQNPAEYPIHEPSDDSSCVMLVSTYKELLVYDSYSRIPFRAKGKWAEGSGASAAMAAMLCGRAAFDSVVIASLVDKSTNDAIWLGDPVDQSISEVAGDTVRRFIDAIKAAGK